MSSYAFWNNKGGVGKSFLCFISACEYAHRHPETDVYVIDLCPQANLSETLLAGHVTRASVINKLTRKSPRATVAGYIEARLSSPFKQLADVSPYLTVPRQTNSAIPANLKLVCGDNLLEILSEAIRQTSQLSIPTDAWRQVITWIKDLAAKLRDMSGERGTMFVIDCNPSFAIYTQLALVAADFVVVPFTADDSSRRAVENVVALLYGIGDRDTAVYARISFSKRAKEEGVDSPRLHTFVSNRQTLYEGKPSKAFEAVSRVIKDTVDEIYAKHRTIFASSRQKPSEGFLEVPDYHSASIVAAMTGTPLHALKAGPRDLGGERIQINPGPLKNYRSALESVVDCF
ncbi:MAG TPA: ParA family protein [Terriglobia bacterium]|nr:ParA family protein [Terriglobia bacterium]